MATYFNFDRTVSSRLVEALRAGMVVNGVLVRNRDDLLMLAAAAVQAAAALAPARVAGFHIDHVPPEGRGRSPESEAHDLEAALLVARRFTNHAHSSNYDQLYEPTINLVVWGSDEGRGSVILSGRKATREQRR